MIAEQVLPPAVDEKVPRTRRLPRAARVRPRPTFRSYTGNSLFLFAAMAVVCLTWWPIYQSPRFILLAVVTVTVGVAIAIVGSYFRWPSIAVAGATVAAFLLLGVALAIPDRTGWGALPTLAGMRELLAASALAWKQLLTITLPVGSYQTLLVPVFVLLLLGTVTSLSIVLRAFRPAFGAILPVVVFWVGVAFGPEDPAYPVERGLAMLIVTIGWVVWLRWDRRTAAIKRMSLGQEAGASSSGEARRASVRGFLAAGIILALAAAGGATATAGYPLVNDREVLRSNVIQPFDPRDQISPLAGFRRYLQPEAADTPMFTIHGMPAGQRLELATMDTYDGVVYSVGSDTVTSEAGSFTRMPYRLDQSGAGGHLLDLTVEVEEYSGVWAPGSGQLEEITFTGRRAAELADNFFYNNVTGTGAVTLSLHAGDGYRLTSIAKPMASLDLLATSLPGPASLPPIPVLPDELANTLNSFAPVSDPPGVRLVQAISTLKLQGYVSHGISPDEPESRSGHASDRITQLLTEKPMVGDQEQYAVTAALMARQLGFPARVIMGFVPGQPQPGEDSTAILGSDVSAWVEVQTATDGWLSFDPTPPIRPVPPKLPEDPTVVARPESAVQPPVADPQQQESAASLESEQEEDDTASDPWTALLLRIAVIAGWTAAGILVVLSPFLLIIAAKWRRRRLRAAPGDPLRRISGGWQEFEDNVRDHGYLTPESATRSEVAQTVGGMRPLVLASVTDRAMFSPIESNAADADRVWASVRDLRESLGVGKGRWERLKALISVRSFDRYHGLRKGRDK